MTLTSAQRAQAHAAAFPDRAKHGGGFHVGVTAAGNEALYAVVQGGQNYRNKSRLYGAYPPAFLPTVFALFPDAKRVLHLFSGSLTRVQVAEAWDKAQEFAAPSSYRPADPLQIRFDNALHPIAKAAQPDVVGNAEDLVKAWVSWNLSRGIPTERGTVMHPVPELFDLVIADPPYAKADQRRYWREAMTAISTVCSHCDYSGKDHLYRRGRFWCLIRDCEVCSPFQVEGHRPVECEALGYVRFRPLNKKRVLAECAKALVPGGWLAWLDCAVPHFKSTKSGGPWIYRGGFALLRSTGHRVRWCSFLERAQIKPATRDGESK